MDEILSNIMHFGMYLVYAFIIFIVFKILFSKKAQNIHSHWSTLLNNFNYSSKDFYKSLRDELDSKKIIGLKISVTTLREKGMMSSKRHYLKLIQGTLEYYICCAPISDATFFSSWLLLRQSVAEVLVGKIPFIGNWLIKKLYPKTFYIHDTTEMIMTFIHQAMLKVIDDISKEKGIRSLSEGERKPIMKDIFKR